VCSCQSLIQTCEIFQSVQSYFLIYSLVYKDHYKVRIPLQFTTLLVCLFISGLARQHLIHLGGPVTIT
jgi:hypothetical protein